MSNDTKKIIEIVVKMTGETDVKKLAAALTDLNKSNEAARRELTKLSAQAERTRTSMEKLGGSIGGTLNAIKRFPLVAALGLSIKGLVRSSEQVQTLTEKVKELGGSFVDAAIDASGFMETLNDRQAWSEVKDDVSAVGSAFGRVLSYAGELLAFVNKWTGASAALKGLADLARKIAPQDEGVTLKPGGADFAQGELASAAGGQYGTGRVGSGFAYVSMSYAAQTELFAQVSEGAARASASLTDAADKQTEAAIKNRNAYEQMLTDEKRAAMQADALAKQIAQRRNVYDPNAPGKATPSGEAPDLSGWVMEADALASKVGDVKIDLGAINDELERAVSKTSQWGEAWSTAIIEASDLYKKFAEDSNNKTQIILDAAVAVQDSLTALFSGAVHNARDFFRIVLQGLAQIAAQRAAVSAVDSGLNWLKTIFSVVGGSVAGSTGTLTTVQPGRLVAHGAAFRAGDLTPFAAGGVVSRPTLFAMARGGLGLMGEAGPEAVMPLKRTASGKLGVAASGGARVVVENHGPPMQASVISSEAETRIVLKAANLGADIAQANLSRSIATGYGAAAQGLQQTYGLRRRG